ncbi:hypothetical protein DFP90_104190 [Aestuariispira insulae]|uniref:Uncharacterized protein n=1 Tax=Aestuariispira insulae TaxID=1461337 RepID=A0A3D9HN81_9PROT|nr:hypothetical protein DFP90_104190 [Aestuariispira insulae]
MIRKINDECHGDLSINFFMGRKNNVAMVCEIDVLKNLRSAFWVL